MSAGPYGTEAEARAAALAAAGPPRPGWSILNEAQRHNMLLAACEAAGLELGDYDHRILGWLTGWEDGTVAVIAGLITRAHAARGTGGPVMTGDRLIRTGTAAAVLLVAAIAATVSFVHIEHLAVTHGQTWLAAVLLPVSIDGTVAAASLVMLRAAREGQGTPWLARFMLVLAVTATLAANIAYGVPYGLAGAALSGWPWRSRSSAARRWRSAWSAAPAQALGRVRWPLACLP